MVNSLTSTWAARAIDHQRLKMSIAPSRSSLSVYGSSTRITVTRGRNQSCRKWLPMLSRGMQQPQDPQQQRPPLSRGNAAVSRMCATNRFLQLTLLHLVTGSSLPAASGPTLGRHHLRSLAPRQQAVSIPYRPVIERETRPPTRPRILVQAIYQAPSTARPAGWRRASQAHPCRAATAVSYTK